MAQYFTDFTEYSTGSAPGDWTACWNTPAAFDVRTGGDDQALYLDAPGDTCGAYWNDISGDSGRATVEVFAKLDPNYSTTNTYVGGPIFRVTDTSSTSEDGYAVWIYNAAGTYQWRFLKIVNGTRTSIATGATASVGISFVRAQMNGSAIKVRAWTGTIGDEPATWDIDTTDSSISAAGEVGLGALNNYAEIYYDLFGVGTNGDAAPTSATGGAQTITPSGVSIAVGIGTSSISAGSATITTSGVGINVVSGSPTVSSSRNITTTGHSITIGIGSPSLTANAIITTTGVSIPIGIGSPTVSAGNSIVATGHSVRVGIGTASLSAGAVTISPTGVPIVIGKGSPSVNITQGITTSGHSVTVGIGSPSLSTGATTIIPEGVSVNVDIGTPVLSGPQYVDVTSVNIVVRIGTPSISGEGWRTVSPISSIWTDITSTSSVWTEVA